MIYRKFVKRLLDLILSGMALILLSPLMLVLMVLIRLDSPGPAFFKQKRIGVHKKHFDIYKFRTMYTDCPSDVPTHLMTDSQRWMTPLGSFMRRYSLDELPQIVNILKGDMSLIGPRPALWNQFDLIAERDRYGANDVLPGLSGWAQINGRDMVTIEEKARLDGEYVEKMSLLFDIKCILRTIVQVLRHQGIL